MTQGVATDQLALRCRSLTWVRLLPFPSIITPATLSVNLEGRLSVTSQWVPQIDFSTLNFVATMPLEQYNFYGNMTVDGNGGQPYKYNGPSEHVKQVALDVALSNTILPITPPFSNSTWQLTFHGPTLECANVSSGERRDIEKNIAQHASTLVSKLVRATLSWSR